MLASTSGRSIFGLRIEPRSPPVQVATWTSTPSATYLRGRRPRPCSTRRRGGRARASAGARRGQGCCGMARILGGDACRGEPSRTPGRPVRRARTLAPPAVRRGVVAVAAGVPGLAGLDALVRSRPRRSPPSWSASTSSTSTRRPSWSTSASATRTSRRPACCAPTPRTTPSSASCASPRPHGGDRARRAAHRAARHLGGADRLHRAGPAADRAEPRRDGAGVRV